MSTAPSSLDQSKNLMRGSSSKQEFDERFDTPQPSSLEIFLERRARCVSHIIWRILHFTHHISFCYLELLDAMRVFICSMLAVHVIFLILLFIPHPDIASRSTRPQNSAIFIHRQTSRSLNICHAIASTRVCWEARVSQ